VNLSAEESRRRLAAAEVGRLATASAEGQPHLVVFTFAVEGDTLVTAIDHKPKRSMTALRRLQNIAENPQVSILVDHYEPDWERLWWARGDGMARILTEEADRRRPVELLVAKYPQYAERPPEGPVIEVTVARWSGWSYSPGG